jgi:CHAD domain-containing protein
MQDAALFQQYTKKCFEQLYKSLKNYSGTGDMERLFRARVSIKKIRTCIMCLEHYSAKKDFVSTRHHLKKIFRSGGLLRELIRYRDWFVSKNMIRVAAQLELDKQIGEQEQKFLKVREKALDWVLNSQAVFEKHISTLEQEQVFAYYVLMIEERMSLLLKQTGPKGWHKLRKEFKRILYARHWQDEKGLKLLSNKQAAFLDRLQHMIGFWHDNDDMIQWLKEETKIHGLTDGTRAFRFLKERGNHWHQKVKDRILQLPVTMRPLRNRLEKSPLTLQ